MNICSQRTTRCLFQFYFNSFETYKKIGNSKTSQPRNPVTLWDRYAKARSLLTAFPYSLPNPTQHFVKLRDFRSPQIQFPKCGSFTSVVGHEHAEHGEKSSNKCRLDERRNSVASVRNRRYAHAQNCRTSDLEEILGLFRVLWNCWCRIFGYLIKNASKQTQMWCRVCRENLSRCLRSANVSGIVVKTVDGI